MNQIMLEKLVHCRFVQKYPELDVLDPALCKLTKQQEADLFDIYISTELESVICGHLHWTPKTLTILFRHISKHIKLPKTPEEYTKYCEDQVNQGKDLDSIFNEIVEELFKCSTIIEIN